MALNRNNPPGVFASDPYHDKRGRFAPDPDTGATHDPSGVLNEALANHGTTDNQREAGYVLPNGKMLDMSAGRKGQRMIDHEKVKITASPGEDKVHLMLDAGAARISDQRQYGGLIQVRKHVPITAEQKSTLRKVIEHHNGKMYVEVSDEMGFPVHDRGYDEGTSHTKILGDIQRAQRGEKIRSSTVKSSAKLPPIAKRKDVSPKEGKTKYGDVEYADETNKKYPIDTEEHIRAAWNYINKEDNASKYSADDVKKIKAKIIAAWKSKIDKEGHLAQRTPRRAHCWSQR